MLFQAVDGQLYCKHSVHLYQTARDAEASAAPSAPDLKVAAADAEREALVCGQQQRAGLRFGHALQEGLQLADKYDLLRNSVPAVADL